MSLFLKDSIIKKEKFTRYKIFNYCPRNPKDNFKTIGKGNAIFITDLGNRFWLDSIRYLFDNTSINKDKEAGVLISYKNNRWNAYCYCGDKTKKLIRNRSNRAFEIITRIIEGFLKKEPPKIINERLNYFLKEFLLRNNIKDNKIKKYDFRKNIFRLCYPNFPIDDFITYNLPAPMSTYFRNGKLDYIIKKCTGFKGRKLKKLICQYLYDSKHNRNFSYKFLFFLKLFKGLLKLDDYYKLILLCKIENINLFITEDGENQIKQIKTFISNFSRERILNFVAQPEFYGFYFTDLNRMWDSYKDRIPLPHDIKKIRELHDYYSAESLKLNNPDYLIEIPEKLDKIDKIQIDDLEIEIPRSKYKLIDYSKIMRNCISSYSSNFRQGRCYLLGIKKLGELSYNLMISNGQVSQFLAKCNQPVPKDDDLKVRNFLKNEKLINA